MQLTEGQPRVLRPCKQHLKRGTLEGGAVDEAGEQLVGLSRSGLGHLVAAALHGHEREGALKKCEEKANKNVL